MWPDKHLNRVQGDFSCISSLLQTNFVFESPQHEFNDHLRIFVCIYIFIYMQTLHAGRFYVSVIYSTRLALLFPDNLQAAPIHLLLGEIIIFKLYFGWLASSRQNKPIIAYIKNQIQIFKYRLIQQRRVLLPKTTHHTTYQCLLQLLKRQHPIFGSHTANPTPRSFSIVHTSAPSSSPDMSTTVATTCIHIC